MSHKRSNFVSKPACELSRCAIVPTISTDGKELCLVLKADQRGTQQYGLLGIGGPNPTIDMVLNELREMGILPRSLTGIIKERIVGDNAVRKATVEMTATGKGLLTFYKVPLDDMAEELRAIISTQNDILRAMRAGGTRVQGTLAWLETCQLEEMVDEDNSHYAAGTAWMRERELPLNAGMLTAEQRNELDLYMRVSGHQPRLKACARYCGYACRGLREVPDAVSITFTVPVNGASETRKATWGSVASESGPEMIPVVAALMEQAAAEKPKEAPAVTKFDDGEYPPLPSRTRTWAQVVTA